jgi:hypothetical protein
MSIPEMPTAGPDAKWAARTIGRLRHSLRVLAEAVRTCSDFGLALAVGGPTTLLTDIRSHALLNRLGFQVSMGEPPNPLAAFFQDLYRAGLVWAFNPPALRMRKSLRFQHDEIWMPKEVLMDRYDQDALPLRSGGATPPGR